MFKAIHLIEQLVHKHKNSMTKGKEVTRASARRYSQENNVPYTEVELRRDPDHQHDAD